MIRFAFAIFAAVLLLPLAYAAAGQPASVAVFTIATDDVADKSQVNTIGYLSAQTTTPTSVEHPSVLATDSVVDRQVQVDAISLLAEQSTIPTTAEPAMVAAPINHYSANLLINSYVSKQPSAETAGSSASGCTNCDQCASGNCNSNSSNCDSCNSNGGCDACHNGCFDCYEPEWVFKAGAVILERTSPRNAVLLENTLNGNTLLNASGFSFNWEGGVDASAIRRLGDDTTLEGRYFGVNAWTDTQALTTINPSDIPINPPIPVLTGSRVNTIFTNSLYSAEANLHREQNDRLSWLGGFRWVQMHDSLIITDQSTTIHSTTLNDLYGAQGGFGLKLWDDGSPLHLDSVFKAGVFDNFADNTSESRSQVAFVGEIDVTAVYQCCEHMDFRVGYQMLWLSGVAVATDQLPNISVSPNTPISAAGGAFYHGLMVSCDFLW